ncbi:hypothetical protein CRU98_05365 [Arcobacter sp. CECT 8986]|uniref:ABC transporter substrate-binding protein n=1 Tax=Arcobacter sp. CECT 8986 TaxID=2044507 RepID=UPI001009F071|nr:ABC transporter substrate-binding protein [Arcobacter sp. CECT 8986]RXJ99455.1 hypothetical protein CRU98_05365 [Arcobacter sp. CECT 8986]
MKKIFLLIFLIIIAVSIYFFSNNNKQTIKIGFISSLSGKYSSIGHSILNGFKLGFDEINNRVDNKNIQIIIKDDYQNVIQTKKIVDEFLDDNINIIIGNSTSAMTKITLNELKNRDDTLLISANASSKKFSKKDDNFIRLQATINPKMYDPLSKYLIENNKKKIQIIYDSSNNLYSQDVIKSLKKSFEDKFSGKIVSLIKLESDYKKILNKLDDTSSIFIIANSIDSAKLIQFFKLNKLTQIIATSAWAKDYQFIEEGGKAVEGVLFCTGYDNTSKEDKYLKFKNEYIKTFNEKPSSASIQAYEAAKILQEALLETTDPKSIKKYILDKKIFEGLQGKIVFDKYGDITRDYILVEVKNQEFEPKK